VISLPYLAFSSQQPTLVLVRPILFICRYGTEIVGQVSGGQTIGLVACDTRNERQSAAQHQQQQNKKASIFISLQTSFQRLNNQ
jgi:hypothetical protein